MTQVMVTGDVTISASPPSAILGDVITFTGRVLIDGVPFAGLGLTIYLDTAPAPPTTIASGDTDSNGYYHIQWTSNTPGNLPIYAFAAAYQGFASPTIIVPIVDVGVEVHLEPRLHGALLEFRYRSYGMDQFLYSKLSVVGRTAWPQGSFTNYDIFQVRFPPQTVGGVSYLEARTPTFMYQNAPLMYTLNLQEVIIPTALTIDAPSSVAPGEAFWISGILYERDTSVPIPNQLISLSYNGVELGSALTGVDGDYLLQASISTEGTYTLKADFAGTEAYNSSSVMDSILATSPMAAKLQIAGSIVTGLVLFIYGLS